VVTSVAVVLAAIAGAGCSNSPYTPQEMQGKVQFRTIGADPKSLDPSFSYTVDEALIVDLIYPTFYKYHYLKRDPFVLELNLGAKEPVKTAWPVTIKEKDGKTRTVQGERYSFTLKNDLRFQDDPCFPDGKGRHITAKDVVYSFKRMADPSVQCPVAPYFADKIVGWPEYSEAFEKAKEKNYDKEMEGVQLDPKDPYTFHVILNQPYPQLRYLMAMHFTAPQAREAVEYYKDEYPRHPVGCGPYYLSDYQPKQRLVLTVNPNRHKDVYPSIGMPGDAEAGLLADAGKQLPLTEKIVFNIIRESTSSWNLFTQGYLDAAGVNNNNFQQVFTASNALSPELEKKGVSLRKETEMCVYYFAFNMNDPVYGGLSEKNKKLRQAISLSINADEYIQLLKQGNASPAEWVLPPGVFGYDPSFQNPYRRFDPQLTRAKKLLAEAGYPDGVDPKTGEKLTLYYDNTATNAAGRQSVGIVSRMIERLGIKVVSRPSLPDQFQAKLLKGQHQFIFYGWYADYPDPENFVFLLYGPNKRPGPNSANYANPEYDRLFEQMRAMDDGPAREEVIRKMRAVSVEDCAWIPVIHNVAVSLTYDWVKNVKAHPLASDAAQYRNIDVDLRQSRQRAWNKPNFVPLVVLAAIIVVGSLPAVAVVRQRVNRRVRRADAGGEGDDS
jgi:ABC-type oligopeptide transport system, periplasmic component